MDILSYVMGQRSVESGGGSGGLVITMTYDDATTTYTLDKTWAEINAVVSVGGSAVVVFDDRETFVNTGYLEYRTVVNMFAPAEGSGSSYELQLFDSTISSKTFTFSADTADDYPTRYVGD